MAGQALKNVQISTVMGASSMYAGQINAVMGYTSTAIGIYAFADIYPSKQRYLLRWLAAAVIIFGLGWGAKATYDYKLILRAIEDPIVIKSVYDSAKLWPIAMYIYGGMTSVILSMLMLRKLIQVHKLRARVLSIFGVDYSDPEEHRPTPALCLEPPPYRDPLYLHQIKINDPEMPISLPFSRDDCV
jgi:hypothetical protein